MLKYEKSLNYKGYEKAEKKRGKEIKKILSGYPNLFSKAMGKRKVSYELKKEIDQSSTKYKVKLKEKGDKEGFFSFKITYYRLLNNYEISEIDKKVDTKEVSNLCDKVLKEFSLLKKVS